MLSPLAAAIAALLLVVLVILVFVAYALREIIFSIEDAEDDLVLPRDPIRTELSGRIMTALVIGVTVVIGALLLFVINYRT